jgi:Ku protein
MAPRANWKGFLRLSLVTCPVALYPATSESEKISFNQINRTTGHRIKYLKVDADTGEEVSNEDITKGYKVDTDTYVEVSKDELENIALESTRTIDIDEFVPKSSIDPRYLIRPYYLVPDGESWARRFRCHPGNYPQHGHGCHRPRRVDEPRAHRWPGADGQRFAGYASAIPLRS